MTELILENKQTGLLSKSSLADFLISSGYQIHKFTLKSTAKDVLEVLDKDDSYSNLKLNEVNLRQYLLRDTIDLKVWDTHTGVLSSIMENGYFDEYDDETGYRCNEVNQFCIITKLNKVVHSCSNLIEQHDLEIPFVRYLLINDTEYNIFESVANFSTLS